MATTFDSTGKDPFTQLSAHPPTPGEALLARIRAEVEADLSPSPGLPLPALPRRSPFAVPGSRSRRLATSALLLFFALVATSLRSLTLHPTLLLSSGAALCILLGAGVLFSTMPGGRGRLGLSSRRGLLSALFVGLALALTGRHEGFVSLPEFLTGEHLRSAVACTVHCLWAGALATTGLFVIWSRTDPFTPGVTGALMGVIGGLVVNLGLGLSCANVEGFHLLVGHGLVVVVLSSAGWALGRRALCP